LIYRKYKTASECMLKTHQYGHELEVIKIQGETDKDVYASKDVIDRDSDIVSDTIQVEKFPSRLYVADTDAGVQIKEQIEELQDLLKAYREGQL
ncbi:MAG: fructose-bisphosphatase class III, partial [Treponema sp.]|nr:fructose-bisphosphatase class III [Treponema sp.]